MGHTANRIILDSLHGRRRTTARRLFFADLRRPQTPRYTDSITKLHTTAHIYHLWLRLHALALRWAGSAYGFHSIGSTITANMFSYAAVRGFSHRNATENFNFLKKFAKTGRTVNPAIAPLRAPLTAYPLEPIVRLVWRNATAWTHYHDSITQTSTSTSKPF